jgi:hypothetical protein
MKWRFWRRRDIEGANELMAFMRWEVAMREAGWREWMYSPPDFEVPPHDVVEVKRREWPMISVCRVSQMRPETNIAGLWWKPTNVSLEPGGIIEVVKTPLGYVLPDA